MEQKVIIIKKRILSLKEMTLRRTIIIFYIGSDILASIMAIRTRFLKLDKCKEVWQTTVEDKVRDKILKLRLPKSVSKLLIAIVKPIGLEIRRWKMFHEEYLDEDFDLNLPVIELLVWKSEGTIDYEKTAEEIVRLEFLSVKKRFKLACLYCLVNYLPMLWERLPVKSRQRLIDSSFFKYATMEIDYWSFILAKKESQMNEICGRVFSGNMFSFYKFAFKCSAMRGNKAAMKYFFRKLTYGERETLLVKTACCSLSMCRALAHSFPEGEYTDVLCYLITMMNPEQQVQLFKEQLFLDSFFPSLLEWRCQNDFLDTADVIWSLLPQTKYDSLRFNIMKKMLDSDYRFSNLFHNFFLSSPSGFRKTFVNNEYVCCRFFSQLFEVEDTETIEIVFRNLESEDKLKLVSSYSFFQIFNDLMLVDKWHLAELCLREAKLSKENKHTFEKSGDEFLKSTCNSSKIKQSLFKRLFEVLKKADEGTYSKRILEDQTLPISKKLHCEKENNVQPKG